MADRYDVVIIGAGPGGYVAAIRAAQLGLKTACVESRNSLGGTCLNIGCIPSKALLQSSEKFAEARHALAEHGIKVGDVGLDLGAMMARKDRVVTTLTRGVEFLFRKNKVDWLKGFGRIAAPGKVAVAGADGAEHEVEAGSIVIATGSESAPLPGITIDEQRILSSTGALALDHVPNRLVVIGGGYIGLELGSVWQRLGAKVTVVELLDRIVPNMDRELATASAPGTDPSRDRVQARRQGDRDPRSGRRRDHRDRGRRTREPFRRRGAGGDRPAPIHRGVGARNHRGRARRPGPGCGR